MDISTCDAKRTKMKGKVWTKRERERERERNDHPGVWSCQKGTGLELWCVWSLTMRVYPLFINVCVCVCARKWLSPVMINCRQRWWSALCGYGGEGEQLLKVNMTACATDALHKNALVSNKINWSADRESEQVNYLNCELARKPIRQHLGNLKSVQSKLENISDWINLQLKKTLAAEHGRAQLPEVVDSWLVGIIFIQFFLWSRESKNSR